MELLLVLPVGVVVAVLVVGFCYALQTGYTTARVAGGATIP